MIYSKILNNPEILATLFLKETQPQNRIVLAEIAGEMHLEEAVAILMEIINAEQDEKYAAKGH